MSSGYPNLCLQEKKKHHTKTHTHTQKRSISTLWNEKLGLICNCQNESFVKFLWKFCEDFMEVCGKFLFGGSFVQVLIGSSYCNSRALH
jgi:hypothetical protein